jgi:hypothetical protein
MEIKSFLLYLSPVLFLAVMRIRNNFEFSSFFPIARVDFWNFLDTPGCVRLKTEVSQVILIVKLCFEGFFCTNFFLNNKSKQETDFAQFSRRATQNRSTSCEKIPTLAWKALPLEITGRRDNNLAAQYFLRSHLDKIPHQRIVNFF